MYNENNRVTDQEHSDTAMARKETVGRGSSPQLPAKRFSQTTGDWVNFDGSPYRIPVMSKERRARIERLKAENKTRLKQLLKAQGRNDANYGSTQTL